MGHFPKDRNSLVSQSASFGKVFTDPAEPPFTAQGAISILVARLYSIGPKQHGCWLQELQPPFGPCYPVNNVGLIHYVPNWTGQVVSPARAQRTDDNQLLNI